MDIKLKCPECNAENDYDSYRLLGVPITIFKSFRRKITAKTGTVEITCKNCSATFKVPKQMIMNILTTQEEE